MSSGDLTLENGPVLVPVEEVESLLELLNLLIGELVKASCHVCNWGISTPKMISQLFHIRCQILAKYYLIKW